MDPSETDSEDYNLEQQIQSIVDHKMNLKITNKLKQMETAFVNKILHVENKDQYHKDNIKDLQKTKELNDWIDSILDNEMRKSSPADSKNFRYVYNQNQRGKFLFPGRTIACSRAPKTNKNQNGANKEGKGSKGLFFGVKFDQREEDDLENWDFYYKVEEERNALINLYVDDKGGEKEEILKSQVSQAVEALLNEGEVRKDIIPGHMHLTSYYLFISFSFFMKFLYKGMNS